MALRIRSELVVVNRNSGERVIFELLEQRALRIMHKSLTLARPTLNRDSPNMLKSSMFWAWVCTGKGKPLGGGALISDP